MSQVKGIPYGISDFNRMRNENFYFVDKTMYLPLIEEMPSYLFLIRPRRFGKSLFLSMMRTYYDIIQKDNFDKYFGDLWIGSRPTKQHNSFQVLFFDFSKAGCSLPGADLMSSFNEYCSIIINQFAHAYASYYDEDFKSTVESIESAKAKLSYIEVKAKEKGYPLYLIIDEYDNFTNVILSEHGQKMFHDLTHASGFYREYFKQFKGMFDRIFLMGVSPITLDDLSSGYNIDWNISTDSRFNAMIGFDETEVREMLRYYQQNGKLVGDVEAMITEMKPWYDNYCFARTSLDNDRVFNCDMTLYYLRNQIDFHRPPENMVDKNIRTDYSKLRHLIRIDKTFGVNTSVIQQIVTEGSITAQISTSFPAEKLTDTENFKSLLFYFGMLSIQGTDFGSAILGIPNLTVREQLYTYLVEAYREAKMFDLDLSSFSGLVKGMALRGEWEAVFRFFARELERQSAIREFIDGEAHVKGFLLAYLGLTQGYVLFPEHESSKGYADFYMMPDLLHQPDIAYSYIVEVKYTKRDASEGEIASLKKEAAEQLVRYAADEKVLRTKGGTKLELITLVFKGWELVIAEKL